MSRAASQVRHPIFARVYTRVSAAAEDQGQREHRRRLLAPLAGRVIEVGAGHGLNFPHYPSTVSEVLAVEPEAYLRARAAEAAEAAPVHVTVLDGVADRLPASDGELDAGVACLTLCTVPDQSRALAELFRVIRPGGMLAFYEHVLASEPGFARFQRVADRTLWPLFAGGCHSARDTVTAIERAGFELEECERFAFRASLVEAPATPHVRGRARRP